MIDEMTAMQEEISKLKAEVGLLRGALADILEIVNMQETYGFSGEIAELWHLAHQKIENARNLAANATSEESQSSEPKFKVGDIVTDGKHTGIVSYILGRSLRSGMWQYKLKWANKFNGILFEDELERA